MVGRSSSERTASIVRSGVMSTSLNDIAHRIYLRYEFRSINTLGLLWLSLLTFGLLWLTPLTAVNSSSRESVLTPISTQARECNPLALLLLAILCTDIAVFVRRLHRNGHSFRATIMLANVAGLILCVATDCNSAIHGTICVFMCIMTIIWFVAMATDYGARELATTGTTALFGFVAISLISPGLGERALICYFLWLMNIFYYGFMLPEGRRWD